MHFIPDGAMIDHEAVLDVKKMIKKFSAEALVITGDLWNNNTDHTGQKLLERTAADFGKLSIPWIFVWGNHDDVDDNAKADAALEKAKGSLYRGSLTKGNYVVEIRDPATGKTVLNMIALDDGRAGVMNKDAVDWFSAESAKIKNGSPAPPAFLFFHIPILQYQEIVDSGLATGVKFEKVCHEGDDGSAFKEFVKAGFVKAIFVGHDHYNNYSGDLDGIKLVYARSTGFNGEGADKVRKGATLVTVDTNSGTFDIESVFPDGSSKKLEGFVTEQENGKIY